ncbi:hypothetical protein MLD38_026946 [Melastoma candidum]|uniref:Uncharacterized protein n=1 Tax=Melastoma candidum TaxID=119954 RepID=A0ACB9P1Q6_9MYRT|nr:hypothetical protein MLD38_026946 [Melastoma candidum]
MIVSLAQKSTHWLLKILEGRKLEESKLERVQEIFRGVMAGYFDSKKSQIKPEFLKEILKRRPWIGRRLLGFMLEKCGMTKSEFRRVEALDIISEILKQLDERQLESSIKDNLTQLTHLIVELAKNTPKKQARRADTRKFCGRILSILSSLNLRKPFLKGMSPEAASACESQLGDVFLNFKNNGK